MNELPKITNVPVLHIDATPDNGYEIRIKKNKNIKE